MDETETVVLCVCVTMSQEDMILSQVSQEDMISSHVYIYVCVVSLIANYFRKLKPICLLKPLRKRKLSYFQSGGQKYATKTCNLITIFVWKEVYVVGQVDADSSSESDDSESDNVKRRDRRGYIDTISNPAYFHEF